MKFYSHGKLLITGEYAVLDGAMSLALPTKFGQFLEVKNGKAGELRWVSKNEKGETWFETVFLIDDNSLKLKDPAEVAKPISKRLLEILNAAISLNLESIFKFNGKAVVTILEFDRNWGLGTSSTLINNIAQWLAIDPYKLLEKTFRGSGYDIAAAANDHPITYQLTTEGRTVLSASFDPVFKDRLFFVYLNEKKNSREAIQHYKNQPKNDLEGLIQKVSSITTQFLTCDTLDEFELLIEIHETLISKAIGSTKVKQEKFKDYPGKIKSLGAWGGDFILATGHHEDQQYFRDRGYNTIINYRDMIL